MHLGLERPIDPERKFRDSGSEKIGTSASERPREAGEGAPAVEVAWGRRAPAAQRRDATCGRVLRSDDPGKGKRARVRRRAVRSARSQPGSMQSGGRRLDAFRPDRRFAAFLRHGPSGCNHAAGTARGTLWRGKHCSTVCPAAQRYGKTISPGQDRKRRAGSREAMPQFRLPAQIRPVMPGPPALAISLAKARRAGRGAGGP